VTETGTTIKFEEILTTSYSIGSGVGVGFGLSRGTGGGGGSCLIFCADPLGVITKLIAQKKKASAAVNSAGLDRLMFCKCINQLLMPPALASCWPSRLFDAD